MAFLLSPKGRITSAISCDFYYRRLRRIAPTYLFVIFATLLIATKFLNEMDRLDLVKEARSALLLYANLEPLFEKVTYFQMVGLNIYRSCFYRKYFKFYCFVLKESVLKLGSLKV